ncbi:VanZ family protein [Clostridium tyrobutyricum]|nr:VanZ family protein [Clostridium tyrobutyricum]
MSLIMLMASIFLVTVLNIVLKKNSKYLKKEIRWQHYLLGYFFIVYLIITLSQVVGFPSLSEYRHLLSINQPIFNPHINLVPFRDGIEITSILNIILFIPLGFLLPTLWKKYRNLWSTFYYGLFFSLGIEFAQLFVRYRATDINDLIMNTIGTICGWIIFNTVKKVFRKYADKTVVDISSSDTLPIKLEPYIYIMIAIICSFFQ